MTGGTPPDLSVVIFTRDDADHLRRCLAGLRDDPPAADIEVIVVDNASRDATPAVVADASTGAGSTGSVRSVRSIRLDVDTSFSAGNNLGLAAASGRFVLFLNPDVQPTASALDVCLRAAAADPSIGLISPRLRWPDGTHQETGWHLPTPARLLGEHVARLRREVQRGDDPVTDVGWLMGAFLLGPREPLAAIGGFDEDFWFHGTDLELCARVGAAGRRVVRLETEEVVHVGHPGWDAPRRRAVHDALVQWLRRDHGPRSAAAVGALAGVIEAVRR